MSELYLHAATNFNLFLSNWVAIDKAMARQQPI